MKEKIAKFILFGFVILFAGLLFADANGYYVNKTYEHKTLTEEQIKKFEEDIKNGVSIDVEDYTINNEKDYTNKLSDGIYKVSLKIESLVDSFLTALFNGAGSLISDQTKGKTCCQTGMKRVIIKIDNNTFF